MEGWGEKRCFLPFHIHFKLAEYFHSVSGRYIQFNYFRKSRESAKNRPVLDDLLDTCNSYLVQAKVALLKVEISMPQQSTMHAFFAEETLENGDSVSKRLYG